MQCPNCNRPMTALFFSCVCDYCDGVINEDEFDVGYVVWRNRQMPSEEYVFPTVSDAERWREANRLGDCRIVQVRAPVSFHWRVSTGNLSDLVTADRLVTIYPDHRFPPEPNRAYIAGSA